MSFYQWITDNGDWIIPLGITILFSVINIIFAIINAKNAMMQYKAQQVSIGISLMQKRMEVYSAERAVLESIVDYSKPTQKQIEDFCHADVEARFLFGDDVQNHTKTVFELIDRVRNYQKPRIPDGEGGFFECCHDYEEEEFSREASDLYGMSIMLYGKYIDFSNIGVNGNSKKVKL